MSKLNYNIHASINYKSGRKGLVNDNSLLFTQKCIQFRIFPGTSESFETLIIATRPQNTYGLYYPKVYGKQHSQYPN